MVLNLCKEHYLIGGIDLRVATKSVLNSQEQRDFLHSKTFWTAVIPKEKKIRALKFMCRATETRIAFP